MIYDIVIIGGGPAGVAAALYGARGNLKTLLIEKSFAGGQMATTEVIENYPGFAEPVNGVVLAMQMEEQAKNSARKLSMNKLRILCLMVT